MPDHAAQSKSAVLQSPASERESKVVSELATLTNFATGADAGVATNIENESGKKKKTKRCAKQKIREQRIVRVKFSLL